MPYNSGNTGIGNWGQDARNPLGNSRMTNPYVSTNNGTANPNAGTTGYGGVDPSLMSPEQYKQWRLEQENKARQGTPTANSWNSTNAQWNQGTPVANSWNSTNAQWNQRPNETATTPASPYTLASGSNPFANIQADMGAEDPSKIYIDQTSQSYTKNILDQYQKDTGSALGYLQKAGQAGVAGYGGLNDFYSQAAAQNNAMALNQGRQMENTYGSAYKTATDAAGQALGYGMQAGQGQLADTGKMMGYYQSLAAKNQLPGQSLIEQNLGQNTAEAMARMKEMGGSSMALLGASGNMYNQQQAGLRDIGIQASQYQAGNQQAQAQAAQQAIGLRAGAYGQMAGAQNLYGQNMQNAASQYGGAQERYMANQQNVYGQGVGWQATGKEGLTQAQMAEQGNLSSFYGNQAGQTSGLLQSLMQQRLQAEQQQADLQRRALLDQQGAAGAGYTAATEAENQSWQQNQYNQWQNQMGYWGQLGGAKTQAGVSTATGNAINAWGVQSQNDYNQQRLDLAQQEIWMNALSNVGNSLSNSNYGG
jgi:hypothetical protein